MKASLPIVAGLSSSRRDAREEHPEKAEYPIDVTPEGMVIEVRLVQSINALAPIDVTDAGM
jgi:hypothetical protein